MNQNIENLVNKVKTDTSGKWVNITEVNTLVESIVRECATLASAESSWPYNSYSEKIKQHFGVKE